jgi:serine/threonine protein phosphatase 1
MNNLPRTFAISDIHGCLKQFKALVDKLNLVCTDTLVLMGDYVDRGSDSKGVIDYILELKKTYNVVTLLGNHESMMRDTLRSVSPVQKKNRRYIWEMNGGIETLRSYGYTFQMFDDGVEFPDALNEHLDFIDGLSLYYETDTHIFTHATPWQLEPIDEHDEVDLIWRRPSVSDKDGTYEHVSGKKVLCGHTAQPEGCPSVMSDKLLMIDTGCFFTGVLTAVMITDVGYKYYSAGGAYQN